MSMDGCVIKVCHPPAQGEHPGSVRRVLVLDGLGERLVPDEVQQDANLASLLSLKVREAFWHQMRIYMVQCADWEQEC